jgi:NADPH:quinone reductase-like Zn-dependent oxidoreductase
MYGLASAAKHGIVTRFGATPIDYRTQDFVEVIRRAEPSGLDAVFDGMVWGYVDRGFSLLRRGATWVQYGNPLSFSGLLRLLARLIWLNLVPDGRSLKLYGTTTSKFSRERYLEDWAKLFGLLEAGKIKPVIMERFPILQADRANELLESGQVVGNLVLVAPDLL